MRRQTVTIATTTRKRVSLTTTAVPVRLHCPVCQRQVETISLAEGNLLADLFGGAVMLHRILQTAGLTRICRDSAATVLGDPS